MGKGLHGLVMTFWRGSRATLGTTLARQFFLIRHRDRMALFIPNLTLTSVVIILTSSLTLTLVFNPNLNPNLGFTLNLTCFLLPKLKPSSFPEFNLSF